MDLSTAGGAAGAASTVRDRWLARLEGARYLVQRDVCELSAQGRPHCRVFATRFRSTGGRDLVYVTIGLDETAPGRVRTSLRVEAVGVTASP